MNRKELNYAFEAMDDDLINNYFKIGAEYKLKRKKKLKWAAAIAACLAVAIMIPLLIYNIGAPHTDIGNVGNNGTIDSQLPPNTKMVPVELFSNGQNLYFTNAFNGQQLIKYDGNDTVLEQVIGKPNDKRVVSGNMLFYTNDEGAFAKDLQSGRLTQLLSFGNEMPYPVTAIDGYDPERGAIAIDKTDIEEKCSDFILVGRKVFFLHNAQKGLSVDWRWLGEEYWSSIYSFDLDSGARETVKHLHFVDGYEYFEYITEDPDVTVKHTDNSHIESIESIYEYSGALYYFNFFGGISKLHKYDMATAEDTCIYSSETGAYSINWGNGKVYFSESTGEESTDDERIMIHVTLDLNDVNSIIKTRVKEKNMWVECDADNNLFYSLYERKIISFEWNDPENFTVLHELSDNIDGSIIYDIKVVDDKLYFSYQDSGYKYCIVEVYEGKEKIIVENGKAC